MDISELSYIELGEWTFRFEFLWTGIVDASELIYLGLR